MSWNVPLETKPIAAMVIYMMYESMSKSRPVFLCLPLCALFAGGHAEFVPGTGVAAWEIVK